MRRIAQSMVEYVALVAIVTAALVGMGIFLKRGMQGNIRENSEQISNKAQYTPGGTTSVIEKKRSIYEVSSSYSEKLNIVVPEDDEDFVGRISYSDTTADTTQTTDSWEQGAALKDEPRR